MGKRIALVGCGDSKRNHAAPACDLYTSNLFRLSYAYAAAGCFDAVFIVSALHGIIEPGRVIEPYNQSLRAKPARERDAWGAREIGNLRARYDAAPCLVILAGAVYGDALSYGASVHGLPEPAQPMRGIRGCGPRMRWLKTNTDRPATIDPCNRQQSKQSNRSHQ